MDFDGGWQHSPELRVAFDATSVTPSLDAWPNPLRDQVALRMTLPQPAAVRLRIFDMGGRLVATLADGVLAAGAHVLPWRSDALGSGRYHAVLDVLGDPVLRRSVELILQK